MVKTMTISNDIFNRMSILKEGLEISWTEYITMLEKNSDRMYRLEKELLKANELLEIMEKKINENHQSHL